MIWEHASDMLNRKTEDKLYLQYKYSHVPM